MHKLIEYLCWQVSRPIQFDFTGSKHLDLGAGKHYHNPFDAKLKFAADIFPEKPSHFVGIEYFQADLTKPLPFEDNCFDSISCYDVLEHIPRWERLVNGSISFPFIELMSEVNRILKPGGFFYALTPAFPSPAAFQDPTHINIISTNTISYFVEPEPYAENYGFRGSFNLVHQSWMKGVGPTTTKLPHPNLRKLQGLLDILRYLIRTLRVFKNTSPSHLLWVLQKSS
jgi:SAM-dependent methyltransferase